MNSLVKTVSPVSLALAKRAMSAQTGYVLQQQPAAPQTNTLEIPRARKTTHFKTGRALRLAYNTLGRDIEYAALRIVPEKTVSGIRAL